MKVGHTDVLVAIYGPICAPQTKQDAEMAHIHVSYRACDAEGSKRTDVTAAKQLQVLIEDVVIRALYPRRGVVVAVEVLSEDGGVAAAVVNAVCVALMDAGVPMRSVPVAAAVAVCNGVVVVDAAKIEESEAQAVITFTFDTSARPSSRAFMAVHTVGDCGGELIFNEALSTCSEIADKTIAFLNLCLRQRTSQQYIWNS